MSYRVTIMPQAASDFEGCFGYIFNRSHQGAVALRDAFGKAMKSLEDDALAHGFAPENGDHPVEIRQILFRTRRNYRAIYTIQNQDVHVLHVRGPGQDLVSPDELQLS